MNKQLKLGALVIIGSFLGALLLVGCSGTPENMEKESSATKSSTAKSSKDNGMVIKEERIDNGEWKERSELSTDQRFAKTLEAHNRVRAKHNLPPLKWSNKLAKYSQQWANKLASGTACQMYHRSGTPPYGENLFRSSAVIWSDGKREVSQVTISDVVKAWANEEKWYNYNNNSCQPGKQCGHYTQVVWKDTKEVGCAMKVCADKSQSWVCSYNPAGNYVGYRPY